MPLDRLAEYLKHLASVLGDPKRLHLLKVETGSTVPVLHIDPEAIEPVRRRGAEIRMGLAGREAMDAYRSINRMLREDNAQAALYEGDAQIIPFPGQGETPEAVSGIKQHGSIEGHIQKVGGAGDWVPVQIRTMDETTLSGCYAKRQLAKQLGNHLFEPVRLYGRGRWTRRPDGTWEIERFWIDSFEKLSDEALPSVIAALRRVKATWRESPVADILKDENE
jgi:hypothetical protein